MFKRHVLQPFMRNGSVSTPIDNFDGLGLDCSTNRPATFADRKSCVRNSACRVRVADRHYGASYYWMAEGLTLQTTISTIVRPCERSI